MTEYLGSQHKEVSSLVRKHMKELSIKGSIKSSFEKVVIKLEDVSLEAELKLKDVTNKYSASNVYNGYEDLVLSNDSNFPQVDYLIISN